MDGLTPQQVEEALEWGRQHARRYVVVRVREAHLDAAYEQLRVQLGLPERYVV